MTGQYFALGEASPRASISSPLTLDVCVTGDVARVICPVQSCEPKCVRRYRSGAEGCTREGPTPKDGPVLQQEEGWCHTLCCLARPTQPTRLGLWNERTRSHGSQGGDPWTPWRTPSGTTLHASSIAVSQACEHTVGTGPDLERWEAVEPAYVITSHEGPRIKLRAF